MPKCNICPRECGVDRSSGKLGFCRAPEDFLVAKTMIHKWEEPCIAGEGGAGTIFFSGCNLRCVFCQNCEISRGDKGEIMTDGELEEVIFDLLEKGAECIEFVTPTHYTERLAKLLRRIKPKLTAPVVWNSGGYEKVESLKLLDGLVDVYMPDFKYFDGEIAKKYSSAYDYFEVATAALGEMLRQTGEPSFDKRGRLTKGTLVRHLVLPGHRSDSIAVLKHISENFGADSILLSLMSQYTPDFYTAGGDCQYKNLCRRVTKFEYDSVMKVADSLGFEGYFQGVDSASKKYTPDF
jgi:putative pyruvate formate lyase activating enzyme